RRSVQCRQERSDLGTSEQPLATRDLRLGYLYRFRHHLFSKALAWGLRPKTLANPLDNTAEPKVARRERLFTGTEIGALLATLDRAALDRTEEPQAVAAIRAAIFTGARIGELLT